jgi:hypothetical protein
MLSKKLIQRKKRRSGKGRVIALFRRSYLLQNTDVFYVESESSDNIYYFPKYKPDVIEFCSCKDYESNRATRCKHIVAIELPIRMGTLKDTDRLSADAKRNKKTNTQYNNSSYTEEDYSF